MTWQELLQKPDERIVAPWLGGRDLFLDVRRWRIVGSLPPEHGWYEWRVQGRLVEVLEPTHERPVPERKVFGYLVGGHLAYELESWVARAVSIDNLSVMLPRVHLVEPGLDKFTRVSVAQYSSRHPYFYVDQEFPSGPEQLVLDAFLDEQTDISGITGVPPALDLAFRVEVEHKQQVEKRRAEERARREAEERCRRIVESLGDGQTRRQLAAEHFEDAARAALVVGGAEFLDHRRAPEPGEHIVRYRLGGQRFECVCDNRLSIVDSGICLQDERTGVKGDTWLTLESLPSAVRQAIEEDRLVIFRHA